MQLLVSMSVTVTPMSSVKILEIVQQKTIKGVLKIRFHLTNDLHHLIIRAV